MPYRSLPGLPHGRVLDRVLFYPGFARRSGEAAARLVREGRADLVHAQGLTALGYARERQRDRGLRAPLVMNPQGMEEHKAEGLKGMVLSPIRALSREAAALSDRVIATDEATRAEVRALLGVSDARIVVLPNGLDLRGRAGGHPDRPARGGGGGARPDRGPRALRPPLRGPARGLQGHPRHPPGPGQARRGGRAPRGLGLS